MKFSNSPYNVVGQHPHSPGYNPAHLNATTSPYHTIQHLQPEEYVSPSLNAKHSSSSLVTSAPEKGLHTGGFPLRRFYFRAIIGVLGPWIVCTYFIVLWRIYLAPIDRNNPIPFGLPGSNYVFYSWFIAGVIGLNLSLYGLAGVEPVMLMEPGWGTRTAMKLMLHADNTWSGPGGWLKTIKWMVQTRREGGGGTPGALWYALALPSMLVFIAWPLSGLTMEIAQGYIRGSQINGAAIVTGFSYENFNERNFVDARKGAVVSWHNALDADLPGAGIIYTPDNVVRHEMPFLNKVPSILPKDDGIPRIFLTAQAENPIGGTAWGAMFQYNCSIIDNFDDFKILRNRNASEQISQYGRTYEVQDGASSITIRNQTDESQSLSSFASNIYAIAEMGYQVWPNKTASARMVEEDPFATFTKQTECYFNEAENVTGDYPGIDQEAIFEIVLWQQLLKSFLNPDDRSEYDFSLDHNITDLHGAYQFRDFQDLPANQTSKFDPNPMSAIGVQCKASSSVGTAEINGERSTFSNFARTDTLIDIQTQRCAQRFDARVPMFLLPPASTLESVDWLASLFSSSGAPPAFYAPATDIESSPIDAGTGVMLQLGYLQAEQLRKSILHAYASYAVQLMYNGGQGFTSLKGNQITFSNPNVTEFVPAMVLQLGVIPPVLPVALFCLWALIGSTLGLLYGFRRRWTEIVDGYTMFRLGTSLPEAERMGVEACSNTLDVEECTALHHIPGMVGDRDNDTWMGRIGLVSQEKANKSKKYI